MNPRLKSLSIQNFRSMRGSVVIPLDAQVVLAFATRIGLVVQSLPHHADATAQPDECHHRQQHQGRLIAEPCPHAIGQIPGLHEFVNLRLIAAQEPGAGNGDGPAAEIAQSCNILAPG